jgi:uncharacterized protein (DUF1501 family)
MTHNWFSCDGDKGAFERFKTTRRDLLKGAMATTLGAYLGASALSEVSFGAEPTKEKSGDTNEDIPVLVTVFLRGGMDGLSLVVPHGEDTYYTLRPTLALAKPGDNRTGKDFRALDLDGFFGLHPAMSPLYPAYQEGTLAAVHAIGSGDTTRSHFEAMATMERGARDNMSDGTGGWLARHLRATPAQSASPLRAVALTSMLPDILRGATGAPALSSLSEYRLNTPPAFDAKQVEVTLAELYKGNDAVSVAGRETMTAINALRRVSPDTYQPASGAKYPDSELGRGLKQTACLIKARVGLEVACLDRGGWDTHVGQGTTSGYLALQFKDVAQSLAAFMTDLGKTEQKRVTVVVMTEFGRRASENSGLGTDHGRASSWLLMGGGIRGNRVYGTWPGLKPEQLEEPGDVRVTTDYRVVLAEVLAKRRNRTGNAGPNALAPVFPDVTPDKFLGIVG